MPLIVIPYNLGYPKVLPEGLTHGLGEVKHFNDIPGGGGRMAALARAFGMRVLCTTAHPTPERARRLGTEFVPLETLLHDADFVSLHAALDGQTRSLIGAKELALMKPTAYLVNTARAEVVDTAALAQALREHRIAGASTDVWDHEPPAPDHPLLGLTNAVLAPHLGWNADTAKWRMKDRPQPSGS